MELFHVVYEDNDMWFTAGFCFATNGFEAIEMVKTTKTHEISAKIDRCSKAVLEDVNFDVSPVITIYGETIEKRQ